MILIKEMEMVHTEDGHNKMWIIELYDNNTVITRWGRIGAELQSKMFLRKGVSFFNKKIQEKSNKGYVKNSI
jgi:predicted DNA-binding WGR domain protein